MGDSSVSTRRYSNRKSETNLSAQNPLNKHRKSIKNKIIIDEQQIYKQRKSQSNMKKKEKYNSAPRTSQQFNPKTIKKRQSLQLNQSTVASVVQIKAKKSKESETKKRRRKTTSETANKANAVNNS